MIFLKRLCHVGAYLMVEARDLTRGEADFGIVGLWSWGMPSSQNLIFLFLELILLMLQGFVADVEDG